MRNLAWILAILGGISPSLLWGQTPKAPLPTGHLRPDDWLTYSTKPLEPGEIDRLVSAELARAKISPASQTTDEQFIRRVYLDLTGRLPVPADVSDFLKDASPNKRSRLIDRLLDSEEYSKHWASYWRTVITSRLPDIRGQIMAGTFEVWLAEQLQKNARWDAITRDMLTAGGAVRYDEPTKNGQAFFMLSRFGEDAATELTAETSRIFLGIQIQCAQCHDHPSDVWKREQFHELAAYLVRFRQRPIRDGMRIVGQEIFPILFREHQMPHTDEPKKSTTMHPRFVDGKAPGRFLTDAKRRQALAEAITSPKNPWFAGAFVNRMWGELMGQAFVQPIDDLGPEKEVTMPAVLGRVSAAFRGNGYDIKELLRALTNSETYQRQVRPGESVEEHLLFAGSKARRMSADALWNNLVSVLGTLNGPPGAYRPMMAFGPFARLQGFEVQFKQEFAFDPSAKPEEVEGSLSQTLMLMNNPLLHQKIQATGTNVLARILTTYSSDEEAIRMVYLKTLARRPTDRERSRCLEHVARVGQRSEAFEDILWALLNSAEFQTQR